MNWRHYLSFLSACSTILACQPSRELMSSNKAVSQVFEWPELSCAKDETPLQYSLIGSVAYEAGATQLEGPLQMEPSSGNYLQATRLDMCLDAAGESLSLQRIVRVGPTIGLGRSMYYIFSPETLSPNPGLWKAIAQQDYADLNIVLQISPSENLLLHGWTDAKGKGFATISYFNPSSAKPKQVIARSHWSDAEPTVSYGELVEGDATVNSYKQNNRRISGPNLDIELNYDTNGQVGMYVGYRFHSITIKDNNPALAQPIIVTLTGDELDAAIKIHQSHHGLSDSMKITIEEATYEIGPKVNVGISQLLVTYAQAKIPSVTLPLDCSSLPLCGTQFGSGSTGGNPPPMSF